MGRYSNSKTQQDVDKITQKKYIKRETKKPKTKGFWGTPIFKCQRIP